MNTSAPSLKRDSVWLGRNRPKLYSFPDMRRCLSCIFTLLVALALVVNGVPAAGTMSVPASKAQAESGAVHGMPTEGCCDDCVPTSGRDTACFAMCVQLPAVLAVVPMIEAISTPAFEPDTLMAVHDWPLAPDPLPPRSLI